MQEPRYDFEPPEEPPAPEPGKATEGERHEAADASLEIDGRLGDMSAKLDAILALLRG